MALGGTVTTSELRRLSIFCQFFGFVSLMRTFQTLNEQVHGLIDMQLQDLLQCHSVTPISVALSPIGDQYEGHVSKVQDVKTNFLVASRVP